MVEVFLIMGVEIEGLVLIEDLLMLDLLLEGIEELEVFLIEGLEDLLDFLMEGLLELLEIDLGVGAEMGSAKAVNF